MARILGYDTDGPDAGAAADPDPDGGPTESTSGSGLFFKLNDFGVGLRSLGWHNFKAILSTDDGLSTDYSFYVDNQLAERVSNVGTAASIRSYDVIRLGSGLTNGNTEAFFDNVRVEFLAAVPEAGSFAAVGLVGLISSGAIAIKKRRAARAAA
jgi:hypothetical protein